jgi:heme-degrading monooxygenase HmoA
MEPAANYASRSPTEGPTMNCTRIALYDIKTGTYDEIVEQAKAGMAPLFQHSPGFVSYGVAQIDKNAFASLSTWQTREQAEAATAKAATWVKENSRDRFTMRANYTGDLAIDINAAQPALPR